MLEKVLKNRGCFKLVCGAGNEDTVEVEKLVALYSKAGCNLFDLCAKPEIIKAAKRGLEWAGILENRFLCCSLGIKGDPHVRKACIDYKTCIKCGNCVNVCPQKAINPTDFIVDTVRCIGCGKCFNECSSGAVMLFDKLQDLNEVLPKIVQEGIDCIEFHALGTSDEDVYHTWKVINNSFEGLLSICIDRSKFGNEQVLNRISKMLKIRKPYTTIIQADGCPMSGGEDNYKTTLQAVAMAEVIQNSKLPVYVLLSGGTNSKSAALAHLCNIAINGVAIGSFARKIVNEYIQREDFLHNELVFNQALTIAKDLVNRTLKFCNICE